MDRRLPRRTVLATGMVAAGGGFLAAPSGGAAGATPGERRPGVGEERAAPLGARQEQEATPVEPRTNEALWASWLELWNGNLALAEEIVGPGFVAHFAPLGSSPAEVRGPAALAGWIAQSLAAFTDPRFEVAVGPLVDGQMLAGRWIFRGTYRGGIPGAPAAAVGAKVEYAGADILRVEAGTIVEYWLSADTLVLLQQLGMIPA